MPPHSRSQRRRNPAQQQRRPAANQPAGDIAQPLANTGATVALDSQISEAAPAPAARAAARPAARRVLSRPVEPVDYSKDYAAVRMDLRWITIWTVLLFVAMIALKFSGLV